MGTEGWEGHSYPGPCIAQASILRHAEANTEAPISSTLREPTPLGPATSAGYH